MAAGLFPIKIPPDKYHKAREYQDLLWKKHGVKKPLWACLVDVESPQKPISDDPFRKLRRGFKL